jgi:Domain of unknown function (DUF4386)
VIRWGGIALIAGAVAFLAVFSYLAVSFNYPDVLDGPAATVLPSLLGSGTTGRVVWTIYAFLPLIWIPAGVAAFAAFSAERRGVMRLAMFSALVAAVAMMLGLMRWPSIHWHLAQAYVQAAPAEQAVIAATFDGLNTYLGNFIGEFLGEMMVSVFFLLTSLCWLRVLPRRRWMAWFGVGTGVAGLIGMFRNVTTIVAPIAALNNYLLPVFMILLGGALMRWRASEASVSVS